MDEKRLVDAVLLAASTLLGATLSAEGAALRAGADHAVVVRARRSDTGQSVIVKGYEGSRNREGWARETAALTALGDLGATVPRLLAAGASPPVVVMADLGSGGSLATALLGASADAAAHAVVEWAETLADLHTASWGRTHPFEAALTELSAAAPVLPDGLSGALTDGIGRLRRAAGPVGVEVGDEVGAEVLAVAAQLRAGTQVVSPFDVCPDNNVRTPTGLVLIDFEGATVAHPAWDVAYLRVPWPSCWCAWRLPDAAWHRAQEAWADRLEATLAVHRGNLDRATIEPEVRLASLVWCLVTVGWFLPRARETDRDDGGDLRTPSLRAVVLHRLATLIDSDEPQLAAVRDVAHRLRTALAADWGLEQLPVAPAFR